jgi:hypothetical protein
MNHMTKAETTIFYSDKVVIIKVTEKSEQSIKSVMKTLQQRFNVLTTSPMKTNNQGGYHLFLTISNPEEVL